VAPIDWLIQHEAKQLGAMYNDVTFGLLADVTVTMVTLTVEHGQMAFLDYMDDIMGQYHHICLQLMSP